MTENAIPYLYLWCSLYRDPRGGGGKYSGFQVTEMIEWGQK